MKLHKLYADSSAFSEDILAFTETPDSSLRDIRL